MKNQYEKNGFDKLFADRVSAQELVFAEGLRNGVVIARNVVDAVESGESVPDPLTESTSQDETEQV